MSNLSRKDFLKLSSWGIVATLLPFQKINAITSIFKSESSNPGDYELALTYATQAKDFFYRKNYGEAETLYSKAIELAPNAIRFYDGLDNVYGAQRKTLESVILYKEGLLINQNKVAFYDRSARSLMRLELGNKTIASVYKTKINSESLLADAKILFLAAIALDHTKLYLNIGLNKIIYKQQINAPVINHRLCTAIKQKRKLDQLSYKTILNSKNEDFLRGAIVRMNTKNRVTLYSEKAIEQRTKHILKQKKKYYNLLLKNISIESAEKLTLTTELYELDRSDSTSFKLLKKVLYNHMMFSEIVDYYDMYHLDLNQDNVYTVLGYMDAVSVAVKRNQRPTSLLDECISKGNKIVKDWDIKFEIKVDVVNKMAKIFIQKEATNDAKTIITKLFQEINDNKITLISNVRINALIETYAEACIKKGGMDSMDEAYNTLIIGSLEADEKTEEKYPLLSAIVHRKVNETFKEKRILYYAMYNFFTITNNIGGAQVILKKLDSFDPLDKFLISKIH